MQRFRLLSGRSGHRSHWALTTFIALFSAAACSGHEAVQPDYKPPETPGFVQVQKMFLWSRETGFAYIPAQPGEYNIPYGINDAGEVVGTTVFGAGRSGTFVWSASMGFRYLDSAGVPPNVAMSINASGTVTGYTYGSEGPHRAFVWSRNSGATTLPQFTGLRSVGSAGHSINAHGEIAGNIIGDTIFTAFRWSPQAGMQLLRGGGELPHSYGVDVNDAGQVIGYDGIWEGWDPVLSRRNAILWNAEGEATQILPECARACDVDLAAVNNQGEVAGTVDNRAFRWSAFRGITGMPGSVVSWARGMNDDGDVIVATWIATGIFGKASLWTADGKVIELPIPLGFSAIYPYAINNKGVVVGTVR